MKKTCARLLVVAAVFLTGCVSTKYKMAPKSATVEPPPVVNLTTAPGSDLEATVNTVIVYQGPGSWKREAYWDEYVVSLANRSGAPVTIESATLADYHGQPVAVGDHPWKLEKASKTWWQHVRTSEGGRLLTLGGATVLTGATAVGLALSGGLWGPTSSGVMAAANAFALVTVAIPLYAVGSVVRNVSSRHQVEAEFQRRRLVLPATLAPGQLVQGSLFFRITPGPQRLQLTYRAGDESRQADVVLPPLAQLHFKTATAETSTKP